MPHRIETKHRPPRAAWTRWLIGAAAAWLCTLAVAAPRVVSPAADATVHSNSGEVQVTVQDVPAGQRIQALLDGAVASPPLEASTIELQDVARGEHLLVVRTLDAEGREVARSAAVRFHVFHASRLRPPALR